MDEEAVKVRKGGGDVRLVGRRRGVGQVGQGEEEGQRRRKRSSGSRCGRNAFVHVRLRVDNSAAFRACVNGGGAVGWVRWWCERRREGSPLPPPPVRERIEEW